MVWRGQNIFKPGKVTEPGFLTELRVGVAAMITPSEGAAYYGELVQWLGAKTGREVRVIFGKNYDEMNNLLKTKEIDVAFICAGPYVEGKKKFGLELLAAPVVDGKTVYYSYIIVAADSKIKKFEELKGKTFAFTDPLSNTGKLVPTYMIAKMGETPETFFKKFIYSGAHDASIHAVINGLVDGAAVDSLIYDYLARHKPGLTSSTKIIEVSPPFGIPMVVARPGLDQDLKLQIQDALLSVHLDSYGEQILKKMDIEKFTIIEDSAYDSIRQMIDFLKTQ